jgi:hypothetical protein
MAEVQNLEVIVNDMLSEFLFFREAFRFHHEKHHFRCGYNICVKTRYFNPLMQELSMTMMWSFNFGDILEYVVLSLFSWKDVH